MESTLRVIIKWIVDHNIICHLVWIEESKKEREKERKDVG